MSENRVEEMLTQLIKMVGNLSQEQQVMKTDMQVMKVDMQEMKADIQEMKFKVQVMEFNMQKMDEKLDRVIVEQQEMKAEIAEIKKQTYASGLSVKYLLHKESEHEREISLLKGRFEKGSD